MMRLVISSTSVRVRRFLAAAGLAMCAVLASWTALHAHAVLLTSEPANGSGVDATLSQIRLVFSEPIDASVSSIILLGPSGASSRLHVVTDPHNVSALIAPVESLAAGNYRADWHTVSADGHRVDGTIRFLILARLNAITSSPAPTGPIRPPEINPVGIGPSLFGAPLAASLLRGLALASLMALTGLLFFRWRSGVISLRAERFSLMLGVASFALLAVHALVWMAGTATDGLTRSWMWAMLQTGPGHMEIARFVAVALVLWALIIARRPSLALIFSVIGVAVSGAIGHPAAMNSLVAIPAKALHLSAGAAWLGGLLWLTLIDRENDVAFLEGARLVSTTALLAVVVIALSGAVQSISFIPSPSDLVRTTYGKLVLAKVGGLLVLVAFGAYHRYRVMPSLEVDTDSGRMRASVSREIFVFVVVTLIGALLANVSPSS